jgi:uncharacterized protein YndB with AHSA1/START domain
MIENAHYHRDFAIERAYPNCKAHVWAVWSIREKKAAWLGNATLEMDFRPGGFERSSFRNDRGEHVTETRYFEIKEGERIVLAYSMAVNARVHTISLTTITFTNQNGGTRLKYTEQMCMIPPSDDVEGRKHGWSALLDGLGDYLVKDTRESVGAR